MYVNAFKFSFFPLQNLVWLRSSKSVFPKPCSCTVLYFLWGNYFLSLYFSFKCLKCVWLSILFPIVLFVYKINQAAYLLCAVYLFSRPVCVPFLLSTVSSQMHFLLHGRSLRSSWRARRPCGCSAMRSATIRASRTKRTARAWTASWGKDRSRYDMTSPSVPQGPAWLIRRALSAALPRSTKSTLLSCKWLKPSVNCLIGSLCNERTLGGGCAERNLTHNSTACFFGVTMRQENVKYICLQRKENLIGSSCLEMQSLLWCVCEWQRHLLVSPATQSLHRWCHSKRSDLCKSQHQGKCCTNHSNAWMSLRGGESYFTDVSVKCVTVAENKKNIHFSETVKEHRWGWTKENTADTSHS